MIVGSHTDDLQLEDELETPIKNYKHALAKTQCNAFLPACPLVECKNSLGIAMLKEWLLQSFEIKGVEEIEYKQWTTTGRFQLQTFIQSTDDFIERFLGSLKTLTRHDFIAQEQAKYLDWKKIYSMENFWLLVIFQKIMHLSYEMQHRDITGQIVKQLYILLFFIVNMKEIYVMEVMSCFWNVILKTQLQFIFFSVN